MNTLHKILTVCLIIILGLVAFQSDTQIAFSQDSSGSDPIATIQIEPDKITWHPLITYAEFILTVATPDGSIITKTFPSETIPTLTIDNLNEMMNSDGQYAYELRLTPLLDEETQASLAKVADDPDARAQLVAKLRGEGVLPVLTVFGGTFTVLDGFFVVPVEETSEASSLEPRPSGEITPNDVIHADDVIVTGSLCVGFDCLTDGSESFGFDTIKLKENNLRIFFDDTSSTAGFPANDWRIITNDSASGGVNYFAIEDSTGAKIPFKIMAGASNNALYVDQSGRIGLGTNTPVLNLHIKSGNTPSIRLEQDASSGWTAQTWDMAGNESNFFIRDTTNGSKLLFRIQPNAPANSLTIKSNGNIGFGTWSPAYEMELERTGQDATFAADRTDGATAIMSGGVNSVKIGSVTNNNVELVVNNSTVMTLNNQGNATLQGVLSEFSDVNAKENFASVNVEDVLSRLNEIQVMTWNYRGDESHTLHMGPTAQDFYSAYSLGADDQHIAPLDVNGVSIASIQALTKITTDQKNQITKLEADNNSLRQEVDSLESRLSALEQAASATDPIVASRATIQSILIALAVAGGLMLLLPAIYRRYLKELRD